MSVYHQYRKSSKTAYAALYYCEGCGRYVVQPVRVDVSVTYNDKGTFTKRGVEARAARADDMAIDWHEQVREGLLQGDTKIFRKAKIKHTCPACKTRPIWAKMDMSKLDTLSIVLLIAMAFMLYFAENSALAIGAAAAAAAAQVVKFAVLAIREKKINREKSERMLFFGQSVEELQQKAQRHVNYQPSDVAWPGEKK